MMENESINGWTFEETVKTAKNLMEAESNMFKWDVLRKLRDFAENYKEELEQYRAIGTVEEIKSEHKELIELSRRYLKDTNELIKYQEIGTVEEFKALKEKNEPRKPISNNPKINEFYVKEAKLCPNCHSYINNCSGDYCRDCGQKLDWQ